MTEDTDNVRVAVRCRPLNSNETEYKIAVEVDEVNNEVSVNTAAAGEAPKTFTFDNVFGIQSKQTDVYNQAARPIVCNVLEGYNGTIFAYGQTGTGKTFTMEGDRAVAELRGIIPNSFAHLFGHIAQCGDEKTFLVRVSYLEIYQEEVRDLLAKNQQSRCELKERTDIGVYVKDLSSVTVGSADEMDKIMTVGNKNRSVGATNMNEHSSRSHAIFTVTVECSEKLARDNQQHVRVGKLNLVDLAGSERQSKTQATGQRLKEATKINLSLSTLGNVISALVDAKATHIPYRNSKLTRLLQDSLGGNAKTVMIANVGPATYNIDETLSTLRYANRAKSIKNHAKINEDPKDALLRKFQQEIEALRKQLEEEGESGGESDGSGGSQEGGDGKSNRKRVRCSDDRIKSMEAEIEADKKRLGEQKDIVAGERKKLAQELQAKESELSKAKNDHLKLAEKLASLEKKVIVGGENLLEKAEEQARLLEHSRKEFEERKLKGSELRKQLEQKQAERLDIEEKYSSLQEEVSGKTKKLKKVWGMLQEAKDELEAIQAENQRETEGLLGSVRELGKELKLQQMIIDAFIPSEYQELVEQNCSWNDEIGDWQLRCIAYTGNNIGDVQPQPGDEVAAKTEEDLLMDIEQDIYLSYAEDAGTPLQRVRTGAQKEERRRQRETAKVRALLK